MRRRLKIIHCKGIVSAQRDKMPYTVNINILIRVLPLHSHYAAVSSKLKLDPTKINFNACNLPHHGSQKLCGLNLITNQTPLDLPKTWEKTEGGSDTQRYEPINFVRKCWIRINNFFIQKMKLAHLLPIINFAYFYKICKLQDHFSADFRVKPTI